MKWWILVSTDKPYKVNAKKTPTNNRLVRACLGTCGLTDNAIDFFANITTSLYQGWDQNALLARFIANVLLAKIVLIKHFNTCKFPMHALCNLLPLQ